MMVIFPALDVMSIFPLVAIAVCDNLSSMVLGSENISNKKVVILIKVLVTLIPFVLSFFVYDLVKIIQSFISE